MSITQLGHTAYVVADMERSYAFYHGILGLEKVFEMNDEKNQPWIAYFKVADGQFIELFYPRDEAAAPGKPIIGYSHLCLIVDDIQDIAKAVVDRGGVLDRPIKIGVDGNSQCWVRDPDGNRIEFMQIAPDSPHASHGAT